MVLSKRERYIVIATVAALALLVLDQVVLEPVLAALSDARARKQRLLDQREQVQATIRQSRDLLPRWQGMLRSGITHDPGEAEAQVMHAVRDWAEEAGVTLTLLKPDRRTEKSQLPQVAFETTGYGPMASISRWLWRMETAQIPLRITDLQLAARKEGADDLTATVRLSTIYLDDAKLAAAGQATTRQAAAEVPK